MPRQWRNSDRQVFEIEPRDDGRWELQREESKRVSRVFDGKREAQGGALTCNGAAKRHIILERAVRVVAEQARRTNATIDHALATSPDVSRSSTVSLQDSAAGTPER